MKINELQSKINTLAINPDSYSLTGGSCDECYVISNEESGKWAVYYSERGLRSSCKIYDTEAEACKDLLNRLEKDPAVKIRGSSSKVTV